LRLAIAASRQGYSSIGWVDFLGAATATLEIAIYDLRLPDDLCGRLRDVLAERRAAGVAIRLVYNGPRPPRPMYPPPPRTDPGQVESLTADCRSIPGVPDLMHHKYVVRDGSAVWTGSTNWTGDSWSGLNQPSLGAINGNRLAGQEEMGVVAI